MSKYLSEQTLRNIQIRYANTEHQKRRQLWIELACKITYMYDFYCLVHNTGAVSNVDVTVEDLEEVIPLFNRFLGTEYGLSDFFNDPDQNANEAIIYYKTYKKLLKVFDGKVFKATVAEKLFEELYNDPEVFPATIIIYHYYSKIADLILEYMCERIDYDTFMQKVLAIKIVPNQRPLDGNILKNMISTGEKWVSRYMEIHREEKAKGQI